MTTARSTAWGVVCGLVGLAVGWVPTAHGADVQGLPGVPVYPGLEEISTSAGDSKDADRVIYECSGEEVGERYAQDPEAFAAQVVAFYRDRLAKQGWKYLGEGAWRHHWAKGEQAIALALLDYCAIEYRRVDLDEARASLATIDEKDFFTALQGCVVAAQAVCAKHGAGDFAALQKKSEEFMTRGDMEGLEDYEVRLRKECRQGMWDSLKPHGVTPERLAQLFEEREDLADQWMQNYGAFVSENAMGWVMVQQLAE
jgi:hypothetical protein